MPRIISRAPRNFHPERQDFLPTRVAIVSVGVDRKLAHPQHSHYATFGLSYNAVVMVVVYVVCTKYS